MKLKLVPLEAMHASLMRMGITRKWLKANADAGRIPHIKIANRRLFNPEAVEAAILEIAGYKENGQQELFGDESK